jgi:hypothetical protein
VETKQQVCLGEEVKEIRVRGNGFHEARGDDGCEPAAEVGEDHASWQECWRFQLPLDKFVVVALTKQLQF